MNSLLDYGVKPCFIPQKIKTMANRSLITKPPHNFLYLRSQKRSSGITLLSMVRYAVNPLGSINAESKLCVLMKRLLISLTTVFVLLSLIPDNGLRAKEGTAGLTETIVRIKQSVVGIGTYKKMLLPNFGLFY
jgi:hypothetical protein